MTNNTMSNNRDILDLLFSEMSGKEKIHLPVIKERRFYPTEASVALTPKYPGESNVIGACQRATYYKFVGGFPQEEYSEYTQWIFFLGKAIEERLVELFKQSGTLVGNNIKFNSEQYFISGEIDIVVKQNGKPIVLEIKSYANYQAMKDMRGDPKRNILGKPKDAHLMQICIYMYLHQHIFDTGKLLYIDKMAKDNFEFNIRLQKEDDKTYPVINGIVDRRFGMEDIFNRYQKLKTEYIDKGVVPPRDFEIKWSDERVEREWEAGNIAKTKYADWQKGKKIIGDWACGWCNFKTVCYEKELDLVEPGLLDTEFSL